jgi:hypothetical protein
MTADVNAAAPTHVHRANHRDAGETPGPTHKEAVSEADLSGRRCLGTGRGHGDRRLRRGRQQLQRDHPIERTGGRGNRSAEGRSSGREGRNPGEARRRSRTRRGSHADLPGRSRGGGPDPCRRRRNDALLLPERPERERQIQVRRRLRRSLAAASHRRKARSEEGREGRDAGDDQARRWDHPGHLRRLAPLHLRRGQEARRRQWHRLQGVRASWYPLHSNGKKGGH